MLIVMHDWKRGDLVKITSYDPSIDDDVTTTGVVLGVDKKETSEQQNMFPLIFVFNFKSRRVDGMYPYNLEILSSH
jgi:hypothetical protein